ncbi:MAG: hypothetical protein AAGA56_08135 [Myxococcota bacterium]
MLASLTLFPPLASAEVSDPAKPVRDDHVGSVGEGGRDLATRLNLYRGEQALLMELHSCTGDAVPLFGTFTQQFRIKPLVNLSTEPRPSWKVWAGAGVGAAYLVQGVCSDGLGTGQCGGPTTSASTAVASAEIGTRFARVGPAPMVVTVNLDSAAGFGTTTTLKLALELTGKAPKF